MKTERTKRPQSFTNVAFRDSDLTFANVKSVSFSFLYPGKDSWLLCVSQTQIISGQP